MVTLTVMRGEVYLTVVLLHGPAGWVVATAMDEDGVPVTLTTQERMRAILRAAAGEDETGR